MFGKLDVTRNQSAIIGQVTHTPAILASHIFLYCAIELIADPFADFSGGGIVLTAK